MKKIKPTDKQTISSSKAIIIRKKITNLGTDINKFFASGEANKRDIDVAFDKIKSDLDSMNEMGEMESLRLQMAMDRMSKMMSTLSNLLKKISDTASSITQNLK